MPDSILDDSFYGALEMVPPHERERADRRRHREAQWWVLAAAASTLALAAYYAAYPVPGASPGPSSSTNYDFVGINEEPALKDYGFAYTGMGKWHPPSYYEPCDPDMDYDFAGLSFNHTIEVPTPPPTTPPPTPAPTPIPCVNGTIDGIPLDQNGTACNMTDVEEGGEAVNGTEAELEADAEAETARRRRRLLDPRIPERTGEDLGEGAASIGDNETLLASKADLIRSIVWHTNQAHPEANLIGHYIPFTGCIINPTPPPTPAPTNVPTAPTPAPTTLDQRHEWARNPDHGVKALQTRLAELHAKIAAHEAEEARRKKWLAFDPHHLPHKLGLLPEDIAAAEAKARARKRRRRRRARKRREHREAAAAKAAAERAKTCINGTLGGIPLPNGTACVVPPRVKDRGVKVLDSESAELQLEIDAIKEVRKKRMVQAKAWSKLAKAHREALARNTTLEDEHQAEVAEAKREAEAKADALRLKKLRRRRKKQWRQKIRKAKKEKEARESAATEKAAADKEAAFAECMGRANDAFAVSNETEADANATIAVENATNATSGADANEEDAGLDGDNDEAADEEYNKMVANCKREWQLAKSRSIDGLLHEVDAITAELDRIKGVQQHSRWQAGQWGELRAYKDKRAAEANGDDWELQDEVARAKNRAIAREEAAEARQRARMERRQAALEANKTTPMPTPRPHKDPRMQVNGSRNSRFHVYEGLPEDFNPSNFSMREAITRDVFAVPAPEEPEEEAVTEDDAAVAAR